MASSEDKSENRTRGLPGPFRLLKLAGWLLAFVVVGVVLSRIWGGLVSKETIGEALAPLRDSRFGLPLFLLVFVVATVVAAPINVFVIGAALTFGPGTAIGASFAGALISAAISYGLGHYFGKPLARKFVGDRLDALQASFADRGIWSVAAVRLMPLGPYGIMNLVAGLSHLRFSVFMIGSSITLLPAIVALTFLTQQLLTALENPAWETWLTFLAAAAVLAGLGWWLRKRLR